MSQKGSSVTGENPEIKYKKALMEIQKIHNANKVLKNQSEEMKEDYQRQINQLNNALQQNLKECETAKHQKADIEKYYDELQVSHSQLRKQYNNLEREYAYLNDVLTQQNNELKKVNAFKDEKGLTSLIASYEDKELNYRKDISRLEQIIKNLKNNYEVLENDNSEQKRQRFKLQDLNNNLKMEMNKYRELNKILISKNQNIVATLLNKSSQGKEKYREAETMLRQLSKQLELVKTSRIEQQTSNRGTVTIDSYQTALHQKSRLEAELTKYKQKLHQYQNKAKEGFQLEQKMKRAVIRSEQLQEQCNMLKGKLIVVETKDVMDASSEFTDLKDLQERILSNITQNDPLNSIKNGSDSSHFQLMKSYILELKQKLSKAIIEKKQLDKRYRSLKQKLTEKVQKSIGFEQQNKLLKGKLQGYERLTERLQFELQRSIQVHDEEVNKMKSVTSNIINKKTEEVKVANAYVRAQLDLQLDKFEKTEKNLRQEVETLKLQLSTQTIKNADLQEKYNQTNEYLTIYQKRFNELTSTSAAAEENNQNLEDNATRYEQMYRQQRVKNEALLVQKQALTTKLTQASQSLEKKITTQQQAVNKLAISENEVRKAKAQLTQARSEVQNLQNILKVSRKEYEDKSRVAMMDVSRTETSYYTALQQNFNQERQKNRQLQAEIQSLKLRLERALVQSQKVTALEDSLNSKNDEINDFRRKNLTAEKQINVKEAEIKQAKNQQDLLRKQNNNLKAKLLQSGQEVRKSFQSKDLDSKRALQKITQELSSAISELREERRVSARLQSDVLNYKNQLQRLENVIDQARNKQLNLIEELNQTRTSFESASDQLLRVKSQIKFKNGLIDGLNNEINALQQKNYKLYQQNSQAKMKLQEFDSEYSELKREVSGLKVYLNEIEEYSNAKIASGGSWQEQRDRQNLSNFVQRIKKLLKKSEVTSQSAGDYKISTFISATSSPIPDYLKNYGQTMNYGYEQPKPEQSLTNSPMPDNRTQLPYLYREYN